MAPRGGEINRLAREAKDTAGEIVEEIRDIGTRFSRDSSDDGVCSGVLSRLARDLARAPAPKQIAVGAAFGWLTGYLTMKVGRMAATAVGGSLIILQVAHHKGYVKVDWGRLSGDSSGAVSRLRDRLRNRSRSGWTRFQNLAADNSYVAGGFTGGFFLGIASS